MRRVVLMVVALVLALPVIAFANSVVDFSNISGTVTGTDTTGLTISSTLNGITGQFGCNPCTGSLGDVSITTGAITSGSLANGGTLNGGSVTITGNGTNGIPSGMIFTSSLRNVVWTLCQSSTPFCTNVPSDGTHEYILTATLNNGHVFQTALTTEKGFFNGSAQLMSGDTLATVVPEPGTLGLLGTGMVGIAGVLRRKLKST
jgi:hypothetical protein